MKTVPLAKVEIDEKGWMRLYPVQEVYDFIYRAAAGVAWSKEGGFLHFCEPGELTYPAYFKQIVSVVASEYGDALKVGPATKWLNVPAAVRKEIEDTEWKTEGEPASRANGGKTSAFQSTSTVRRGSLESLGTRITSTRNDSSLLKYPMAPTS